MSVKNKTILCVAALTVTSAFCAVSAFAEIHRPQAYDSLTAVELAPSQAPRSVHGVADLSGSEKRHPERLPLQLRGAVKKVEKKKYAPKTISRDFLEDL